MSVPDIRNYLISIHNQSQRGQFNRLEVPFHWQNRPFKKEGKAELYSVFF